MSLLVEEIRHVVATIRTKPYPIADLIPLLNRAADLIAGQEDLIQSLNDEIIERIAGDDL